MSAAPLTHAQIAFLRLHQRPGSVLSWLWQAEDGSPVARGRAIRLRARSTVGVGCLRDAKVTRDEYEAIERLFHGTALNSDGDAVLALVSQLEALINRER
jgi:hypothetical protein